MKKIVIVGALGYLGTELCKIYSGESWRNKIIALDSRFVSERVNQLKEWNIDSRPTFYPLSHLPMFTTQHNKNAENFSKNGINLPSGHNLEEHHIEYICQVLEKILEGKI